MEVEKTKLQSFVQWVGGKAKSADLIIEHFPTFSGTYIEPFLGGGAMLFKVQPKVAVVNDLNINLINCYRDIQYSPEELMNEIDKLKAQYSEKFYYQCRDEYNNNGIVDGEGSTVRNSALFIFMNKTCFNGLYRENKSGKFNASFGKLKVKTPVVYIKEDILAISKYLNENDITFHHIDAIQFLKDNYKDHNDFIYADPPYMEMFSAYNGQVFTDASHQALFDVLHNKNFVASNKQCDAATKLYPADKFIHEGIKTTHSINRLYTENSIHELLIKPRTWYVKGE